MRKKKGIITSAKMQDTVAVTVHRHAFHPIYQKRFRRSTKFLADCKGIADLQEGDTVVIAECKPLSKRKYFRVTEVVNRVPRVSDIAEEQAIEKAIHREKEAPPAQKKKEVKPMANAQKKEAAASPNTDSASSDSTE